MSTPSHAAAVHTAVLAENCTLENLDMFSRFATPVHLVVVVVVVVVVEWLYYSKRIIIVRWADLSDFFVDFRR